MDRPDIDKHSLFVGEGVTIEGRIDTGGRIEVHGLVTGDVSASEVQIGAGGRVEGAIRASRLDISGFAGNSISATDRLLVRGTARLEGDVSYGSIQIDAGASIVGTIREQARVIPEETTPAVYASAPELHQVIDPV
jgi:cytoskeletal protein CcmA (bactofilin family)